MMTSAYATQSHEVIVATLRTLQHFRAFLASDCRLMRDPYDSWGDTLDKQQAQRKLTWLVHTAISRKGGDCLSINDSRDGAFRNHRGRPARKCSADYRRGQLQDSIRLNQPRLRIDYIITPELRARFSHRVRRWNDD